MLILVMEQMLLLSEILEGTVQRLHCLILSLSQVKDLLFTSLITGHSTKEELFTRSMLERETCFPHEIASFAMKISPLTLKSGTCTFSFRIIQFSCILVQAGSMQYMLLHCYHAYGVDHMVILLTKTLVKVEYFAGTNLNGRIKIERVTIQLATIRYDHLQ